MSMKSAFKQTWDMMVLLFAIYNSLLIPLEQAFPGEALVNPTMAVVDTIIDFIFFIDIVLMFFTSCINRRGKETFDSYEIAVSYMTTRRFCTDALSLLGT